MAQLFANNATSTLASGITNVATSLSVQAGHGAKFPSPTNGDFFLATIVQGSTIEIVKCTARSGDVLTVVRGQEGTTGFAFSAAARVDLRVTKATLEAFSQGLQSPFANNLIVNPRMAISQENGNASSGANNYYAADQWFAQYVTSAGAISFQRVQVTTPRKSTDRLRLSVTTADTSLAAGEYLAIQQNIEGNRADDLGFGAAGAKSLVVRFGFKGPAGTYSVGLRNNAANRSCVKPFTVAGGEANTDIEVVLTFPGDVGGTWERGTLIGLNLSITLAAGSTFVTSSSGQWGGANVIAHNTISNGLGANTNVFELFDVGLYPDPDALGVAPSWRPNDFGFDLFACQRYWRYCDSSWQDVHAVLANRMMSLLFIPEMRVAPTLASHSAIEASANISSFSFAATSTRETRLVATPTAAASVFWHQRFTANARM
jgi:hypothetical protein